MGDLGIEGLAVGDIDRRRQEVVLANVWELKARKGTDEGVLFGLPLLGMKGRWTQWWEQSPKGEANTYECRVFIREPVIEGDLSIFSAGAQEAALNMIDPMKRWSQEGTFGLGLEAGGAMHMAARRRTVTRKAVAPFRETSLRSAASCASRRARSRFPARPV